MEKAFNKAALAKSIISDKDEKKPGKLAHVRVEPADNGFIVEAAHHKPGKDSYDHKITRSVHNTAEEAAECVKGHCDGMSKAASAAEERSELEK